MGTTIQKSRTFLCGTTAPQVGLEPTTLRLTAECSAIELLRHACLTTVDILSQFGPDVKRIYQTVTIFIQIMPVDKDNIMVTSNVAEWGINGGSAAIPGISSRSGLKAPTPSKTSRVPCLKSDLRRCTRADGGRRSAEDCGKAVVLYLQFHNAWAISTLLRLY